MHHPLPDPLLLENLLYNRPLWTLSYYLNQMVGIAKKFYKELKTPENKPFILLEKSLYHFFALASAEYEIKALEKVEYYIIKEEFIFLENLINKYCKGFIQIKAKEEKSLTNYEEKEKEKEVKM